jgi:hypothetical protein
MPIHIGPILFALPSTDKEWKFSIQITVDAADAAGYTVASDADVAISKLTVAAKFNQLGWTVLNANVSVPRKAKERALTYAITDAKGKTTDFGDVAIPALGRLPRFATFSCNGFMHERDRWKVDDPGTMWGKMETRHKAGLKKPTVDDPSGFHLLVGGGDQVYADENATLIEFHRMPKKEQATAKLPANFIDRCIEDYLKRYQTAYSVGEMRRMM